MLAVKERGRNRRHVFDTDEKIPTNFIIETLHQLKFRWSLRGEQLRYVPFLLLYFFHFGFGGYWAESHHQAGATRAMFDLNHFPGEAVGLYWDDISDVESLFQWIQGVVIQQIFLPEIFVDKENNPYQAENEKLTKYSLGCNKLVGALRFKVRRAESTTCADGSKCWDNLDKSQEPFGPDGYYKYSACNFTYTSGVFAKIIDYDCGGFVVDIPYTASYDEALAVTDDMLANGFVSSYATRLLSVEAFMYCNTIDKWSQWKQIVEFGAGGGMMLYSHVLVFSLGPSTYQLWPGLLDILIALYIGYFWVVWWLQVVEAYRHAKNQYLINTTNFMISFLLSTWQLYDFINLAAFSAGLGMKITWLIQSAGKPQTLVEYGETWPEQLEPVRDQYLLIKVVISMNIIISSFRLLKFAQFNRKIGILVRTIKDCYLDVMFAGILFGAITVGYSLSGMVIFGHILPDFWNITTAVSHLSRWVLTDFDYWSDAYVNPTVYGLYFFTYHGLAGYLALNLFVAVLTNTFIRVKTADDVRTKEMAKLDRKRRQEKELAKDPEQEEINTRKKKSDGGILKYVAFLSRAKELIATSTRQQVMADTVINTVEKEALEYYKSVMEGGSDWSSEADSIIEGPGDDQNRAILYLDLADLKARLPSNFREDEDDKDWIRRTWDEIHLNWLVKREEDDDVEEELLNLQRKNEPQIISEGLASISDENDRLQEWLEEGQILHEQLCTFRSYLEEFAILSHEVAEGGLSNARDLPARVRLIQSHLSQLRASRKVQFGGDQLSPKSAYDLSPKGRGFMSKILKNNRQNGLLSANTPELGKRRGSNSSAKEMNLRRSSKSSNFSDNDGFASRASSAAGLMPKGSDRKRTAFGDPFDAEGFPQRMGSRRNSRPAPVATVAPESDRLQAINLSVVPVLGSPARLSQFSASRSPQRPSNQPGSRYVPSQGVRQDSVFYSTESDVMTDAFL